jgi:PAS domain-containing protein
VTHPAATDALIEAIRVVALRAEKDLDAVLDAVTERAQRLLGADAAALQLIDPATGDLVVRRPNPLAVPGSPYATPGTRYRPGLFTRQALQEQRALFTADFQADERHGASRKHEFRAVASSMVVPLLVGDDMVGTLYIDWTRPASIGPDELKLAEAFGQQAALAIRIVRAVDAMRERAAEAQRVHAELEAVFDATEDSVVVLAPDGKLLRANRHARETMARIGAPTSSATEIHQHIHFTRPDGTEGGEAVLVRALRGEHVAEELRMLVPGAPARYVHVQAVPVRGEGDAITAVVVTTRDVTELRTAVAEQARLDGAVKTARSFAHLINNELAVLTGYAEVFPNLRPDRQALAMQGMAKAAHEVAGLVERLQRIVRFEETDLGGGPMLDLDAASRKTAE